jgi:hypothetical protein
MDDSGKMAYSNAISVSVGNFFDNLKTNSSMVLCSPDGKDDRSIYETRGGEVFTVPRVNRTALMKSVCDKATEFSQRSPSDAEWSTIFTFFDLEVDRLVLRDTDGAFGGIPAGITAGMTAGAFLAGPTFGLSMVVGGLLGSIWGVDRQEKKQSAARDENREKISAVHQKAIAELSTKRQEVIDAILACNH